MICKFSNISDLVKIKLNPYTRICLQKIHGGQEPLLDRCLLMENIIVMKEYVQPYNFSNPPGPPFRKCSK